MPVAVWGDANPDWGVNTWGTRKYPPGASWAADWRWWYQYATSSTPDQDITTKVVEARWTTDAYTPGDGTFRGDCQPGRLQLRLYDPTESFYSWSKLGTVWATYVPTGDTWCWFIEEVTGRLAPAGDPNRWDVVVTADTWASRLTASSYQSGRPAETVTARINAIVSRLATDTGLVLPAVSGSVASDTHTVPAVVQVSGESSTVFPGFLAQLRDAASNGVMWLQAVAGPARGYPGALVIHYDLVETAVAVGLYNDQVVGASIWNQTIDNLVTEVAWHGVNNAGVASDYAVYAGSWGVYGIQKLGPLRLYADISQGGAARAASDAMANAVLGDRGDPNRPLVDTMDMRNGDRTHVNGTPSTAWDPTTMTWDPRHVIQWYRVSGQPQESYWVVQTSHRLVAGTWEASHTLMPFSQPSHIP